LRSCLNPPRPVPKVKPRRGDSGASKAWQDLRWGIVTLPIEAISEHDG
jgi:hypothetical protein